VDAYLQRRVSVIAEAAFRSDIAAAELLSRQDLARIKLIRCSTSGTAWFDRFHSRGSRPGHVDDEFVSRTLEAGSPKSSIYHVDLAGVPTLDVDTTSGYEPELDAIVAFAAAP
jgi:hypothetical protein